MPSRCPRRDGAPRDINDTWPVEDDSVDTVLFDLVVDCESLDHIVRESARVMRPHGRVRLSVHPPVKRKEKPLARPYWHPGRCQHTCLYRRISRGVQQCGVRTASPSRTKWVDAVHHPPRSCGLATKTDASARITAKCLSKRSDLNRAAPRPMHGEIGLRLGIKPAYTAQVPNVQIYMP